jgi:hypothetical protein
MSNNTVYNVVVDFEKLSDAKDDDEIMEEFPDAIHVERIGHGQIQVGYGVVATSPGEAYRSGVNLVEAQIGVSAVGPIQILSGSVYGNDENWTY